MIFLKPDLSTGLIVEQHHKPFDSEDGKGMSREELEKIGVLVESIPDPVIDYTKDSHLHINLISGELFYTYTDRILTPEEEIKRQMKIMQTAIDDLIMGGMM